MTWNIQCCKPLLISVSFGPNPTDCCQKKDDFQRTSLHDLKIVRVPWVPLNVSSRRISETEMISRFFPGTWLEQKQMNKGAPKRCFFRKRGRIVWRKPLFPSKVMKCWGQFPTLSSGSMLGFDGAEKIYLWIFHLLWFVLIFLCCHLQWLIYLLYFFVCLSISHSVFFDWIVWLFVYCLYDLQAIGAHKAPDALAKSCLHV